MIVSLWLLPSLKNSFAMIILDAPTNFSRENLKEEYP